MTTAESFTTMAVRIEHNANSTFGGACVIIPPEGGGDAIELLLLDASADPAQFWSTIATRIQVVLTKLDDQKRAYGMR